MKKYFSYLICLILLSVFSSPIAVAANGDTITIQVGVYENAPKIYTAEDGTVSGFWPDLIRYIAAKENWKIEWISGTWNQGLDRPEKNQIDIMPDTGWTEQRSKRFDFSQETVLLSWSRLYAQPGTDIQSILDLEDKTIAGMTGSFNLEGSEGIKDITDDFNIECTIVGMDDYTQIFKALERGEIDIGVTNKDFGNQHEMDYNIERTPIIFQPAHMLFAFTKKADFTPYLIERIDAQLKDLKADKNSFYYKTLEKHIGGKVAETFIETVPKWLETAMTIGGVFVVFLLAIVAVFRNQVKRKTYALSESEERLGLALKGIGVGMWDWMVQSGETTYDERWANIVGYTLEELSPVSIDTWLSLVHPDDLAESDQLLEKHLTGEADYYISKVRMKHKNGHWVWVLDRGKIFERDAAGKPIRMAGTHLDITDQVRAEEKLQENEQFLQDTFNGIQDGISVLDTDLNILRVNAWMKRMYASHSPLEGKKCYTVYQQRDTPCPWCPSLPTLETGETHRVNVLYPSEENPIGWIDLSAYPLKDIAGRVVGVIEHVRDITKHKQAERKLEQHTQQLETLNTVNAALSSSLALDDVLKLILDQIQKLIPLDSAAIFLLEDEGLHVVMDWGITPSAVGHAFPGESQLFQEIQHTQRPLILTNAQEDPRFTVWGYIGEIQSWLGIPLFVSGKLIGYMTLDNKQPNAYDSGDAEIAQSFATQAAQAIENARLHKRIQQHADMLEERVRERTAELQEFVNLMAGREIRMTELKEVVKELRAQLEEADLEPVADDPLRKHEL